MQRPRRHLAVGLRVRVRVRVRVVRVRVRVVRVRVRVVRVRLRLAHLGLLLEVGLPVPLRARRQRGLPRLRAREQLAPLRRCERARLLLLVQVVDQLGQLVDVLGHALVRVRVRVRVRVMVRVRVRVRVRVQP